jgi:hypothetical protein
MKPPQILPLSHHKTLGCRPIGVRGMQIVPDSRNKFAIDPMANAQRYPKNEQPK